MEDDAGMGVKPASRLMAGHARGFIAACYAGMVLLLGVAACLAGLGGLFWPVLVLPACLLGYQALRVNPADPALCLRQFRANREIGLAVALALLAGLWHV